ncbi:hypothetical protein GCM10010869_30020 [Mesorhizobium tianshanense]|nr:hypothetical protein GCM10010869_30020 [Mesorhizobium tianshanense]
MIRSGVMVSADAAFGESTMTAMKAHIPQRRKFRPSPTLELLPLQALAILQAGAGKANPRLRDSAKSAVQPNGRSREPAGQRYRTDHRSAATTVMKNPIDNRDESTMAE